MFRLKSQSVNSATFFDEVEMANSVDDPEMSQSIFGRQCPNFDTLDARIATALTGTNH